MALVALDNNNAFIKYDDGTSYYTNRCTELEKRVSILEKEINDLKQNKTTNKYKIVMGED